jgi:imidazole glycerol-phosphate synthase subunit HisH
MIAIIDYEIGNLGAVANMLNRIGAAAKITSDPSEIEAATKIILPGNGAFDACMRNLRATGLVPLLENKILKHKVPVLGICVGAQMLGHGSEEGVERGLGWIDLNVRRLPQMQGLRVPHMGWNEVQRTKPENYLVRDMDSDARFYFVHSYYMQPVNKDDTLLMANYGLDFAAGVSHENISGVQFHPEKSHRFGKNLLANFAAGDK